MFTDSNALIPTNSYKIEGYTKFFNYYTSSGITEVVHIRLDYKDIGHIINMFNVWPESRFVLAGNDVDGYHMCNLFTWYGSIDSIVIGFSIDDFKNNVKLKSYKKVDVFVTKDEINQRIKYNLKIILP